MHKKRIIGLMSGTSLDGIDLACVDFWQDDKKINWEIIRTQFYAYPKEWKEAIAQVFYLDAQSLLAFDAALGNYFGQIIQSFIFEKNIENVDFIASHGHTIFHRPDLGYTLQIGHGAHIFSSTQIPVICDFRKQDVAMGGQGAPLVPIGDKLLFAEYQACVNLGGFANISFDENNNRIAFDICPVNFVLNQLCEEIGKEFDENGEIAKNNEVNAELLEQLNSLEFYQNPHPKSLGKEWVDKNIFPILNAFDIVTEQKIATFTAHTLDQISLILNKNQIQHALFSGGGAKNSFLIKIIKEKCDANIIVAENPLLDFKEAIVFALLGYLKIQHKTNIFSSVTGASIDTCGGVIYH